MLTLLALLCLPTKAESPPSVVIVLCDDLGYGDVSPLNAASRIPTPAFHRLAGEGMTFTDAHTPSAVCTPTRYGLLTGRYAWRSRLKRGVLGGYSMPLIEEDRTTVADVLKSAGYRTAVTGKWHLGLGWHWNDGRSPGDIDNFGRGDFAGQVDFSKPIVGGPRALGFDTAFLVPASLDMTPYVYVVDDRVEAIPSKVVEPSPFPAFFRGGEAAEEFRHVDTLDRIVERTETLILQESDRPLLLYVPLTAPHKPVLPHPRFRGVGGLGPYSDFIVQTDAAVGRILDAVDASGRSRETIVIVTSDNGSFMRRAADDRPDHSEDQTLQAYRPQTHLANGPLRGTKADIWEAGHRVPMFVRWPGVVEAASVCDRTVCLTDVLPTLAEAAGVPAEGDVAEDGVSLVPLLRGEEWDRGPVVHHSGNGLFAVREGRWKLVFGNGSGGRERPTGKPFAGPYQLFDLAADLGETTDVAAEHPDVISRLTESLRQIAGAEVPF